MLQQDFAPCGLFITFVCVCVCVAVWKMIESRCVNFSRGGARCSGTGAAAVSVTHPQAVKALAGWSVELLQLQMRCKSILSKQNILVYFEQKEFLRERKTLKIFILVIDKMKMTNFSS